MITFSFSLTIISQLLLRLENVRLTSVVYATKICTLLSHYIHSCTSHQLYTVVCIREQAHNIATCVVYITQWTVVIEVVAIQLKPS